jgi:hypothetical protein
VSRTRGQPGDDHVGQPALLELRQGAVLLERGDRLVDAADQPAALLEEQAELLLPPGRGLELPDDGRLRDLRGGDVEGRGQVGEDRVGLPVEQRLLGLVRVVEDGRLGDRLDDVGDRGQRRRSRLRP